jgi:hypothetical protein
MLDSGIIKISYNKIYPDIEISFQDIGNNTIQADISGKGLLNYDGKLDAGLLLEINTNILKDFKMYSDYSGHSSEEIGHKINLTATKKYNKEHQAYEYLLDACIVFKKPVINASAYSLQPTITVISSCILEQVFIQN